MIGFFMFFHLCSNPRRGEWIDWMKDRKPKRLTRISYKQYIMKAESLLEHKCFFLVFVFTGQQYFKLLILTKCFVLWLTNVRLLYIATEATNKSMWSIGIPFWRNMVLVFSFEIKRLSIFFYESWKRGGALLPILAI